MRSLLVLSALTVAAGCSAELRLPEGEVFIRCASDADCPEGHLCQTTLQLCTTELDVTAPSIVSATAATAEQMSLSFSEVMAAQITNVGVAPALEVSATRWSDDGRTLTVFTARQTAGQLYTLTLDGFTDRAGNALAAPASVDVEGFRPIIDATPPDLLSPADHARLFAADGPILFAWTGRAGAESYELEVSATPDFQILVGGAAHHVEAPAVALTLSDLPADTTLYWRVRSSSAPDVFAVRDFDLLGDAVHVRCADDEDCTDEVTVQNGTPTRPFRRINDAVTAALALGGRLPSAQPVVRVATRAAGYAESVQIVGGPLQLLGGFSADFASRDVAGDRTLVRAVGTALRVVAATQPVLIEGFTWVGHGALNIDAVELVQVGGDLELRNATVRAESVAGGLARGVRLVNATAPGPSFENVTFEIPSEPAALGLTALRVDAGCFRASALSVDAGSAQVSEALSILGPSPCDTVVSDSRFTSAGATTDARGVFVNDRNLAPVGQLRLTRVSVRAGPAERVTGLELSSGAGATVDASTVIADFGVDYSYGFFAGAEGRVVLRDSVFRAMGALGSGATAFAALFRAYQGTLVGNTFAAGDAAYSFAAWFDDGGTGRYVARNNVFATRWATGICVREGFESEIASFEANAMLTCSTLYQQINGGVMHTSVTTIDQLDNTASLSQGCPAEGTCAHRRVNGSIAGADAWTAYFVDPEGANADAADDLRLLTTTATATLRSGGKDPTGEDCGVHEAAEACGGTLFDRGGTGRDAPYSVGAYEHP